MSDTPKHTAPEQATDTSVVKAAEQIAKIDQQIKARKESKDFSWSNFLNYGVLGAVGAWMGQGTVAGAIRGSHLNGHLTENPEFQKELNAVTEPAAKQAIIDTMVNKSIEEAAEKGGFAGKLARSQVKNAGAWKIGSVAVALGSVLGWEIWQQMSRKEQADKDIADLNDIKKSWAERITKPAEADISLGHHSK